MAKSLPPAELGRRIFAGAIDALLLSALCAAYFLVPLLTTGLVLPMWGVLAAGIGYAIVPLAAFRATLGMKLQRIELRGLDGRPANPGDLVFRELVGRGLLPGAFLFTLFMSFIGSLLHLTRFALPSGVGWAMALVSMGTMAIIAPGHLLPLFRPDRRSLADFMSRTAVVDAQPDAVPEDEEERADLRTQRRGRLIRVVVFELILAAGAIALPRLLAAPASSTEEYADRITRVRMEKEFERAPGSELATQNLVQAYRKAGRLEDAQKVLARHLEASLAEAGCDQQRSLSLGERLNEQGNYDAALKLVSDHEAKCGAWPRLLWVSLYSHQQRGEWKDVAQVATRLIDSEPEDSDYWWWRGEAYAKLGEWEQAAADYHQSMANQPNGFASLRYARWVGRELKRPCEGAFALGYWVNSGMDDDSSEAAAPRAQLFEAGDCGRLLGRGRAVLKLTPEAAVSTAKGDVGGNDVTFELSQLAGYTLVTKAFATQAGLDAASGPEISVRWGGDWKKARLVTLPAVRFGQAKAEQVLAAAVDELPNGFDAVMGVNLEWRFRVSNDGDALKLEPLPR